MSTLATLPRQSLQVAFAQSYGIQPEKVFALLKDTALRSKDPVSDAEIAAFMIVCNQYELNPFVKEIYGFISKGKMQYVISVDGWVTLVNRNPQMNGIEFEENFDGKNLQSITCKIHRKDRSLPTVVTEYLAECRRDSDVWKTWPVRMLRHKALIQCSRIAFGMAGVMDEDEAERMAGHPGPTIEGSAVPESDPELDELFGKLTYNTAQRNSCQRNFPNRDAMLTYLRGEVAKMGSGAKGRTPKGEPKPPTEDKTAPEGVYEGGATSTDETEKPKDETKKAVDTSDNW